MPFKKNGPGCNCFCDGSSVLWAISTSSFTTADSLSFDEPTGDGTETDPLFSGAYTGGILLSAIPGIGANAEVIGVDADRKRWVVQRSNGEVWTIDRLGEHPEQLFTTGADTAGEEIAHFKWMHDWGVGVGHDESNNLFSVDSNGDYIQGPYTASISTGYAVDTTGNIYHMKNFGSPKGFRVAQNDVEWARGISATATTDDGQVVHHDGTDLYLFGTPSATVPGETNGLYVTQGLGATASLTHNWTGTFSENFFPRTAFYWDSRRNQLRGLGTLRTSGNDICIKANLSATRVLVYSNTNFVAFEGEVWMAL